MRRKSTVPPTADPKREPGDQRLHRRVANREGKHPAGYFLVELADGVGSGVFILFGFRLISCFCVDRFLFRFGGRFLRPQRACHVDEEDLPA